MKKPVVFVTRCIPFLDSTPLRKYAQVKVSPQKGVINAKQLLAHVKKADALLCLLTDKIDKQVIDANPKLKIIANYAVGFDNIDIAYAAKKGIPVSNTPSLYSARAVAEHAIALMLAAGRDVDEADLFTTRGHYRGWNPNLFIGPQFRGKTLGIIGLGRIGFETAKIAIEGLGMHVEYFDVVKHPKFDKKYHSRADSIDNVLKKSDFVSIHTPLLPSTFHLIDERRLRLMKKTAFLINTSRGPVVDEKALAKALAQKRIAGAALDVYEFEPRITKALTKLHNIVLTPHIASATVEARNEMTQLAVNNVIAALRGKKIPNKVN